MCFLHKLKKKNKEQYKFLDLLKKKGEQRTQTIFPGIGRLWNFERNKKSIPIVATRAFTVLKHGI